MLKLKDWSSFDLCQELWPRHQAEVISSLPYKECTDPFGGALNLAMKLPDYCVKPDMGQEHIFSYGLARELGHG